MFAILMARATPYKAENEENNNEEKDNF